MNNKIFNKIISDQSTLSKKSIKHNKTLNIYELENKISHTDGERALWQSVIMQAILDIMARPKKLRDKIERQKTISWFSENNEDFMNVCLFADLSPEFVMSGFKGIMKNNKTNIKSKKKVTKKLPSTKNEVIKTKNIYKFTA